MSFCWGSHVNMSENMDGDFEVNAVLLNKIESFLADPSYKDYIENVASYNTRLKIERSMRLPFLDSQTGVAQNHSNLWLDKRHRMPGLRYGQVYTYPVKRWKKKKRQYLSTFLQPKNIKEGDIEPEMCSLPIENTVIHVNEDSKESSSIRDEMSKDSWYYDELEYHDTGDFEEPDADSDFDYEDSYSKRKKKKSSRSSSKSGNSKSKRKMPPAPVIIESKEEMEKPFVCDICGVRYKTRPGLSYHYAHSHKDKGCVSQIEDNEDDSINLSPKSNQDSSSASVTTANNSDALAGLKKFQDSFLSFLKTPGSVTKGAKRSIDEKCIEMDKPPPEVPPCDETPIVQSTSSLPPHHDDKATPSPYCDFCLGDATENKKSGQPEELVSCSDCGRSGHPSCLQFTDNMIISVKKYRWQCIECKCCTLCGTSDNDDQLLFCDDCDRGYHMYCLNPPLSSPPEGSWSCHLCIVEFHSKVQ